MAKELTRVSFEEFSTNLADFFARVVHGQEEVVVEGAGGEVAVLKPARVRKSRRRGRTVTAADHEAFLSAFGGWKDLVDTDKLLEDIYESRAISTRPHIEL